MEKNFLDHLANWVAVIVGIIFIIIIVLVSAEVFFRYVLFSSIRGSYEISQYLCIWLTFLGVSVGLRRAELTSIEFVKNALPKEVAKWVTTAVMFLMMGFLALTVWYSFVLMIEISDTRSPAVGLNMAIPYAAVPLGSFLMIVFLIEGLFK